MRTIVHISDLHFDHIDPDVVKALAVKIFALNPDVLAVSGDVTQRARSFQFKAFRAFINQFQMPKIIVPGNHDIPLYNIFRRLVSPLRRFRKIVESNKFPAYEDEEIFVLGFSTPRRWKAVEGFISKRQVEKIRRSLQKIPPKKKRILVCHHPLSEMEKNLGQQRLAAIGERVDVTLSGHIHMSESTIFPVEHGSVLLIRAGTATSTRTRGELNSFNRISIQGSELTAEIYTWNSDRKDFYPSTKQFIQTDGAWHEM